VRPVAKRGLLDGANVDVDQPGAAVHRPPLGTNCTNHAWRCAAPAVVSHRSANRQRAPLTQCAMIGQRG
jgi:hypothetical protein